MVSNFLDGLKNAVENGEFNSEAAKKINEINELADEKIKTMVKPEEIKLQDIANKYLATLTEIEEMVQLSIQDMFDFIGDIEKNNPNELSDVSFTMFKELLEKINEIKLKYGLYIKE